MSPTILCGNPYMYLHYLWSISRAKDRRYPKYFYSMCGLFLLRKAATLQRSVARDFGGVSQINFFLGKDFRKLCFSLPQESP